MNQNEFDAIVIGGGITGLGVARDCALRGIKVLLIERLDIADGATGRNHGLLHSGGRYAVTDRESAEECIVENKILRKVAANCVDQTEGWFITLPEDDLAYQDNFIKCCQEAGIDAVKTDPKEALFLEPSINPDIIGAVKVPDASVDPFRLAAANMLDAKLHGATVLTYTEVLELLRESDRITGVKVRNTLNGECCEYHSSLVINAAGVWGQAIAAMAGVEIKMFPAKGSLLIFGHRVNNMVINRCRKPANADILVPGGSVTVIGTTSDRVPLEECNDMTVTPQEVEILLQEGCKLSPLLASTRILRAYAGVRPLVASDDDPSGRSISRGISLFDHETRDGLKGFITIAGGKLTSYRLMSELCTDLACKKLGLSAICTTRTAPLPGSEIPDTQEVIRKNWGIPTMSQKAAADRLGTWAGKLGEKSKGTICECEEVSIEEAENALDNLEAKNLIDLRRRTRIGMGTCQAGLCACRAAGLVHKAGACSDKALDELKDFVNERWKGMMPVAWHDSLRENEYNQWIYRGICGLDKEDRQ